MKAKLLFILLLSSSALFSQDGNYKWNLEEIRSKKISFITEKVQFTPKEAQVFWPLYNEMQDKKTVLNQKTRQQISPENIKTEDYERINDAKIDAGIKKALLEKEYYLKFKQILSEEKIYNLYKAERDFKKELIKEIQQSRATK